MKRFIFVEPNIENGNIINSFFYKNNPDSSILNPHICLVFPFDSNIGSDTIDEIIKKAMEKYNSFEISLEGLSISYEGASNFLFLNVIDENNILKKMCHELYSLIGSDAKLRGEYIPHITIGKSKSVSEINKMYNEAKEKIKGNFNATITSIYSKIIIEKSKDDISIENEISYSLSNGKTK